MSLSINGLEELLSRHSVPAISFAVCRNFRIAYSQCLGVISTDTKEPVWPDTIFQAASISKAISSLLTLKLVEQGRLDLDKPVNDYLKSWKLPENKWTKEIPVTTRHLLAHFGGITVPTYPGYIEGDQLPTLLDILDGIQPANTPEVRVETAVNEKFIYSTGGFVILQLLLEEVTKTNFETLTNQELFIPLKMHRTSFGQPLPIDERANAACGHRKDKQPVAGNYFIYPSQAGSGIWTTPTDLAKVAVHLQNILKTKEAGILRYETIEEILTPYKEHFFGLGFALHNDKGSGIWFGHTGNTEGFRSMFIAHKENGAGAFILVNSDNADPVIKEVINRIAQTEGWEGFFW